MGLDLASHVVAVQSEGTSMLAHLLHRLQGPKNLSTFVYHVLPHCHGLPRWPVVSETRHWIRWLVARGHWKTMVFQRDFFFPFLICVRLQGFWEEGERVFIEREKGEKGRVHGERGEVWGSRVDMHACWGGWGWWSLKANGEPMIEWEAKRRTEDTGCVTNSIQNKVLCCLANFPSGPPIFLFLTLLFMLWVKLIVFPM